MKKKLFSISLICMLLLVSLTGCTKKTVITTEHFKSIAQSHNYILTDATNQYASYGYIKEATIASIDSDSQVEFYVLDTEENAKYMFTLNKTKFESSKGSASTEKSFELGNHASYTLNSNDSYMYLSRIDNTLIYVNVPSESKDTVKSFVDELKY